MHNILNECEPSAKAAMAGVCKGSRDCATESLWYSVDPRVFTVLTSGSDSGDETGRGGVIVCDIILLYDV